MFIALLEKFWIPFFTTLAIGVVKSRLERKPKVIAFLSHASSVSLLGLQSVPPPQAADGPAAVQPGGGANQQLPLGPAAAAAAAPAPGGNPAVVPPPAINTHSIVLRNVGKLTAFNVRIGHQPQAILGYQLSPSMAHTVLSIPTGGWEIVIPTLVPNEVVQVAYVYAPMVTWQMIHSHFKSNDGAAETINVVPAQIPSNAYRAFRALFVYTGIFSLTYVLFVAAQWVYLLQRAGG